MRKSYLPAASQPWGAEVERAIDTLAKRLNTLASAQDSTRTSFDQMLPTIGGVNVVSERVNSVEETVNFVEGVSIDAVTWKTVDPVQPPGSFDTPADVPTHPDAVWFTVDADGNVQRIWQWVPSNEDPNQTGYVAGQWINQTLDTNAISPEAITADLLAKSVSDDITTAKEGAADASAAAAAANAAAGKAQTAADSANQAAADAAGIAAGKGKIIYATSAPTGDDRNANNLWINTAGSANTPNRWNGTAWVPVSDKKAVDAANAAANAQTKADQAFSAAQDSNDVAAAAGLAANHAQQTADGKNTVYYQTAAPAGADLNLKANDVWYDTDDGYKMYRYSGTEWVATTYGASALSDDINDSINTAINDSTTAKQVSEQAAIDASSAVVLRVDSTRGLVFKNSLISTVLTVTVFGKGQTITNIIDLHDAFGAGAYLEWSWRRIDDTDFGIISSADSRLSEGGFKLTVSPEDVDIKTVFMCSLNV